MNAIFGALSFALIFSLLSCSHISVSSGELQRIRRPVFLARTEKAAGPFSEVFQLDSSYDARLKNLSRAEGDRRLQEKIASVTTPFEVGESLRSETYLRLPRVTPWTQTVDPASVARAMETLLVNDTADSKIDYDRLKPLNADVVVELVIERFGLKSLNGKAGVYVEGFGRMYWVNGGTLWARSFRADQVRNGENALDPFDVAKNPHLFREELLRATAAVGVLFANDLSEGLPKSTVDGKTPAEQNNGLE